MSHELFDGNCIGLAVEHAISEVKVATADCPIPIVGECAYITLSSGVLELTLVFTSLTVDTEEAHIAALATGSIEA